MRTVLLIDDEVDILTVGALTLERVGGLAVLTATNGRDGAALAAKETPDLVVVDLMMPEMDGIATLAALRADPRTSAIPVVLMTAKRHRRELETLLGHGFAGVITKPFDPLTLPRQLTGIHERTHVENRDLAAALHDLRAEYRASLPQRVAELRAAVASVEREPADEVRRVTAERLAHRLKGTAGSLGFAALSDLSGELEELLAGLARAPSTAPEVAAERRRAQVLADRIAAAAGSRS